MSKIIAIDAGHGMKTAGKRCLKALDPNQTREWWLNDRIADKLQEMLSAYDCRVIRVDDTTGAKDISLSERVKTANAAKADVYISIHHNAGRNGRTGGGTVVYFCSSKAERLGQAQRLYNAVVARTGLRGNRSVKVKKHGYYVIKKTKMPAFLVENGFMDSADDVPVILSAKHAQKTAQGIMDFLVAEFSLREIQAPAAKPQESTEILCYPAYTGKKVILSAALTSLGINSSYAFRKQIAQANDMIGYRGTATQNAQMYNLLTAGLLKRPWGR